MIRVDRSTTPAPPDWTNKAIEEQRKVSTAYKEYLKKKKTKKDLEFSYDKFKAYGDDLLRDALNKAYAFKCAYCESFFGATQPVAVEHYRPKGAFQEGKVKSKPGYYWLASTYENLLPSCTDCNSQRYQVEEDGTKVLRGKGNYFPLEPGSKRARSPGREKLEKPLLLHPEMDDPDRHLEFATNHESVGVIRTKRQNGVDSPKGLASIQVYALDRPQLVEARKDFAKRLLSHIRNTRNSEQRHRASPNDANLKAEFEQNKAELLELFLSTRTSYCAMARQIARAELPGLAI